ncbi:AAA family ATPase [Pseudonocardia tropica]|uniref:AAA family ATPase n=1 Tax=Pseudonocardia tropica TaxID=681289 RepID=A0ABV1JUE6_9PSEU
MHDSDIALTAVAPSRPDDVPPPEEPPPADDEPAAAPARAPLRSRLRTLSGLASLPPVRPLVDGLLYRGTLAQLTGAPGSYKSFVTVGMACSVAAGVSFEGHAVDDSAGPVVYVAAEGATGLRARILAWAELTGIAPAVLEDRLYVLDVPVQLGHNVDVAEALAICRDVGASLLVLDTRARCTVGLEENSSTEQGRAIAAVEALIAETGTTVLPVHHSGRNGTAGRGSNAWDGAVWSDLRMASEANRATITCEKHKDVPDGCEHYLKLVPHTVSAEAMPEATTAQRSTLVAVAADGRPEPEETSATVAKVAAIVAECAGIEGLTRAQIRDLAVDAGVSRAQVYRAVPKLAAQGRIRDVSTGKVSRYVVAGPALFGPDRPDSETLS